MQDRSTRTRFVIGFLMAITSIGCAKAETNSVDSEFRLMNCEKVLDGFVDAYKLGNGGAGLTTFKARYLFPMAAVSGRKIPIYDGISSACLELFRRMDENDLLSCFSRNPLLPLHPDVIRDIVGHLTFPKVGESGPMYIIKSEEEVAEILLATFQFEAERNARASESSCADRIWFLRDRFLELTKLYPLIESFRMWRIEAKELDLLEPHKFLHHTVAELRFPGNPVPMIVDPTLPRAITRAGIKEWAHMVFTNSDEYFEMPLPKKPHKVWSPQIQELKLPHGGQY